MKVLGVYCCLCPSWQSVPCLGSAGSPQAPLRKVPAGPACSVLQNQNLPAPGGFALPAAVVGMSVRGPAASHDALSCPSRSLQYVIKTVEVESSKTKQALSESQTRNQHLQEQVAMQRQVLKEMEQQLQNSHQLTVQLRAQVGGSGGPGWGRRPPVHPPGLGFGFSFPLAMRSSSVSSSVT